MPTTSTFHYRKTIGIYALNGRGFNNPVDVALGHNGVLYVLNRAGADTSVRMSYKRVTMCTLDEDYLGEFSTGGTRDGELMWPASIAVDREGHLYISDEALQRISVFDNQGHFLYQWGVQGQGTGEFDRPAGLAFDADDHLFVVDGVNNRVQRYAKDGRFLSQWGQKGHRQGEFDMPWGIAIDHDQNVYVADWRNDRVQKFDPDGTFLATWGTPGQGEGEFCRPAGVAVDAEGLIYVADWGNERVQVLTPDGQFLMQLRGDADLSSWAKDYFLSNPDELRERQRANLEPELSPRPIDGLREVSASIEKLFWGPTAVKVDPQGPLYVADSCRHRLQVYEKSAM